MNESEINGEGQLMVKIFPNSPQKKGW